MGTVLDKNSSQVRKRIEKHQFDDEDGEEYEGSKFHGFGDYFRRKKIKLQNLDADMRSASDKPQLFKGIVAHVTGYTQPPLHILHRAIVEHGGGFLQYLDSKTMATHIIASTLPPKKSVDFSRYRIVKPAWIMDSINTGQLLPWTDYRVLDEGPRQKVLKFDAEKGFTQTAPKARHGYREQTDNSFYTSQFKETSLPSEALSMVAEATNTPLSPKFEDSEPVSAAPDGDVRIAAAAENPQTIKPSEEPLTKVEYRNEIKTEPITERPKHTTSEEHNAWLLSDPKMRQSSTANPDFLKQFYSESRLHHLSTWKADLKSKMQRLAAEKGQTAKPTRKRPGSRRYIMHVDFDSFFCAVSLKRHPTFQDKPAVVAHGTGSGSEIASCNYPAREYGIKNGMWMKRALDLCPDLKVMPYDFPGYEEASRLFYESILEIGGLVQSVSVDEALVDVTANVLAAVNSAGVGIDEGSVWREQDKVDEIALALRKRIKEATACDVSVGIGGNILQAKVALRKAKPAGQYQLKPDDVLNVIGELQVQNLPGVAFSIGGKLEENGIKFVKDIRDLSKERLVSILGPKTGEKLWEYSRGIDNTEVGDQPPRKSVSAEVNWGIRFISQPEAEEFVRNLCKELEKRLLNEQVKGSQLTMKIMRRSLDSPLDPAKHLGHGKCDVFNKSVTFGVSTNSAAALGREAVVILRSFKFSPGDLRGLGVQMTKLEPLKGGLGNMESSQRKLTFNTPAQPSPTRMLSKSRPDPILEGDDHAESDKRVAQDTTPDPITDDPVTPRKTKVHPAMALAKAARDDQKSRTPLNVSGTQFIIPSNPDHATLAELPSDIRSKLAAQRREPLADRTGSTSARVRSQSPGETSLIPSQVDPEVFNALPDDMKAEILASYRLRPEPITQRASPSKDQRQPSRTQTTPTKRGGVHNMFLKGSRQRDAQAGLLQTNFKAVRSASEPPEDHGLEDLDPDVLAELPEEMRKEVMADHRRRRLAQRSGLDAPASRHHANDSGHQVTGRQQTIQFPQPPPRISFANSGVSTVQEIKEMLDAWHSETQDEGPHSRDVDMLEKYLVRVVAEERDLEKVVKMIRWLVWLVEQGDGPHQGQQAWSKAIQDVTATVQNAVKQRGLSALHL